MLTVLGETLDIPLEFQLSMAIAAYCPLEMLVQLFCYWVLYFKAKDIYFGAVEAPSGIAHLLPA
jgi:hypothetical protein